MRTTYMAKQSDVERKWYVVDATDLVLGRLSVEIATVLRGKHKPTFTPHIDGGDYVIVVNAEKVALTGNKLKDKKYYQHSGYAGGLKTRTAEEMFAKQPQKVIELYNASGKKHLFITGLRQVGKSTMLSLITGARAMQDGKIPVLGGDMRDREHRNRICPKIAYMPQGLGKNLYFTLTVEENLQFFARLFGHDAAERRRRIDMLTKSTGLARFLDRPAGKLSGGWQRRVSIAMALISEPQILFLDEPTLGLDVIARHELWETIRSLKGKVTIILTTHYMEEAEQLSDYVAVMVKGDVKACGTVEELKKQTNTVSLEEAFITIAREGK